MKPGEPLKPFLLKVTILLAIALLWEVKVIGLECRANIKRAGTLKTLAATLPRQMERASLNQMHQYSQFEKEKNIPAGWSIQHAPFLGVYLQDSHIDQDHFPFPLFCHTLIATENIFGNKDLAIWKGCQCTLVSLLSLARASYDCKGDM